MPPKNKPNNKKKVPSSSKNSTGNTKNKKQTVTEKDLIRIQKAKEDRSIALFYKLSEPEPDEETIEQKIARKKKELKDNTFL